MVTSPFADQFALKGRVLLDAFGARRPTRDTDFAAIDLADDFESPAEITTQVIGIRIDDGPEVDPNSTSPTPPLESFAELLNPITELVDPFYRALGYETHHVSPRPMQGFMQYLSPGGPRQDPNLQGLLLPSGQTTISPTLAERLPSRVRGRAHDRQGCLPGSPANTLGRAELDLAGSTVTLANRAKTDAQAKRPYPLDDIPTPAARVRGREPGPFQACELGLSGVGEASRTLTPLVKSGWLAMVTARGTLA